MHEPYSRNRHIEVAHQTREAFADASRAMKRAAGATFLLNVPVLLHALDVLPPSALLVALALWAWPTAVALVRVRAAHKTLAKLDRMNREAP